MSGTVYQEMSNILMGTEVATALRIARDTGTLGSLFPELADMLGHDQQQLPRPDDRRAHVRALDMAARVEAPLEIRWALLFHDAGKPEVAWTDDKGFKHFYARSPKADLIDAFDGHLNLDHEEQSEWLWLQASDAMGVDKATRKDVATLIRHHMVPWKSKGVAERTRRMRVQFGDDLLRDLLLHRLCDLLGKDGSANQKHVNQIAQMESYRVAAQRDGVPVSVRDLKINGRDVMAVMPERNSVRIGEILKAVLDEVVVRADEMALSRDWQLKRVEALACTS
jgi:tRNA nucleotidyltransferase (CCA-adding enzyme)